MCHLTSIHKPSPPLRPLSSVGAPTAADRRKRAIRSLKELLKGDSPASTTAAPPLGEDSVQGLFAALTCDELVHLMEWEQVVKAGAASHTW